MFCGCFEYINTHESARTCEGRPFIRRWDFGWLFTYLGISAKKMLFQDKVQSLMTCGSVVQMTCMSIIASAMFFKQHKKKQKKTRNSALMIPVRFFFGRNAWVTLFGIFLLQRLCNESFMHVCLDKTSVYISTCILT